MALQHGAYRRRALHSGSWYTDDGHVLDHQLTGELLFLVRCHVAPLFYHSAPPIEIHHFVRSAVLTKCCIALLLQKYVAPEVCSLRSLCTRSAPYVRDEELCAP